MGMMGIKGMDYLNEVWDLAKLIGCQCKDDDNFAQDCQGSVMCDHCKKTIITQYQVDVLEVRELIKAKPKLATGRFLSLEPVKVIEEINEDDGEYYVEPIPEDEMFHGSNGW